MNAYYSNMHNGAGWAPQLGIFHSQILDYESCNCGFVFVSSFERIDHYIYTLFTHFCLVRSVANSGIIGTEI